ncbi:MAG TPA: DUF402 domain-containing protein [Longimicrobiales bacterium]|nr:DUF402 domain-containing protein [Longimicrobiales bacterium]
MFEQWRVYASADVVVTFVEHSQIERVVRVGTKIVLEPGAPVVWFTFPGADYDIGRFHRADGTCTGLYANILTPVEFTTPTSWKTTDLFLDVWFDVAGGVPIVLDRDELAEAEARGWITADEATRAKHAVEAILEGWRTGTWPPAVVEQWTVERARAAIGPPFTV